MQIAVFNAGGKSAPPMRQLLPYPAEEEQPGLNETHLHFAVIKGGRLKGFRPGQKFATPPVFSILTNQASVLFIITVIPFFWGIFHFLLLNTEYIPFKKVKCV